MASDRTSRRRLADLYTRNGWATVDAGDPSTALLWFVKAIETAGDDPTNAEAARIRLARPWPRPRAYATPMSRPPSKRPTRRSPKAGDWSGTKTR